MPDHKLTPVEWEVMEAIWELDGSPSVRDVLEYACPDGEKAYTTIQTIMNTLEKKGFLHRRKIGMVNFYKTARSRDQMVKSELNILISRVFKGNIPALANYLVDSDDLSLNEIQQIKSLLSDKEKALREDKS